MKVNTEGDGGKRWLGKQQGVQGRNRPEPRRESV